MKDGYYLSVYSHIDSLSFAYQLSPRHDHNFSLWNKTGNRITVVHYWELERITGQKKHSQSFLDTSHFSKVINDCLGQYGLSMNDINEIWGTPGICDKKYQPTNMEFGEFAYHSVAHLFSSAIMDTNIFYDSEIIALSMDAAPDLVLEDQSKLKKHFLGVYFKNGEIIGLIPISSPGPIWNTAKRSLGMEEGSLMALSSASKSVAYNIYEDTFEISDMESTKKAIMQTNGIIERIMKFTKNDEGILFNYMDPMFSEYDNKISMIMKVIQDLSERIVSKNIELIRDTYGLKTENCYISISGGYALNCPSNRFIYDKFKFLGALIPPCVSDCGLSLGIALQMFYGYLKKFNFKLDNAYYGNIEKRVINPCDNYNIMHFIEEISPWDEKQVVKDIVYHPIVWFSGRAEIGPRALGNRSIIADPRKEESKDILNKIKERQWWRPVAPIILNEYTQDWLENAHESPYMLFTFYVKKNKKELVPAILHLDGTVRIQSVKDSDGDISLLLKVFYEATGLPILCNTSLNDKGEPIIDSFDEALNFALRKKISVIYVNKTRFKLRNFDDYEQKTPYIRKYDFDNILTKTEINDLRKQVNPYDLSLKTIQIYTVDSNLKNFSLKNRKDAKIVNRISDILVKQAYLDEWFESGREYLRNRNCENE